VRFTVLHITLIWGSLMCKAKSQADSIKFIVLLLGHSIFIRWWKGSKNSILCSSSSSFHTHPSILTSVSYF